MIKRLLDVSLSAVGLLVTLPVLAVIAVAIRMETRGPVLFRQVRVGRDGRHFRIHKFRTMRHAGGPGGGLITVGADSRITRVGRVLRRLKLDELPQLLDVLSGSMSLVGPRPEVPQYVETYPPELRRLVLSVRPGITDEASIRYRNESELLAGQPDPIGYYRTVILPEKLRINAQYVVSQSLLGDLGIIWRTICAVIRA